MRSGKELAEETNQSLLEAVDSIERAKHGLITLEVEGKSETLTPISLSSEQQTKLSASNDNMLLNKGRENALEERVPQNPEPSCTSSSQTDGKHVSEENGKVTRTGSNNESVTQTDNMEREQLAKHHRNEHEERKKEIDECHITHHHHHQEQEEFVVQEELEQQHSEVHHVTRVENHDNNRKNNNNNNAVYVAKTNYSMPVNVNHENKQEQERQEEVTCMTPAPVCSKLYEPEMTEVIPPILTYDMIHDPIEVQPAKVEYFNLPDKESEERQITNDDIAESISAFDGPK